MSRIGASSEVVKITTKPSRRARVDSVRARLAKLPNQLLETTLNAAINERSRKTSTHLPGLPAEVRNQIYRYALIDPERISVNASGPRQPTLLSVGKQIRGETLGIYYTENKFYTEVMDYDGAALFYPFMQISKYYCKSTGSNFVPVSHIGDLICHGVPNWQDLVAWMEVCHEYNNFMSPDYPEDESDDDLMAVGAVFRVLQSMYSQSWETVEKALEACHAMMIMHDCLWAT